jgi:hypothetical protein
MDYLTQDQLLQKPISYQQKHVKPDLEDDIEGDLEEESLPEDFSNNREIPHELFDPTNVSPVVQDPFQIQPNVINNQSPMQLA